MEIEYLAPLITTLFFLLATLAGIYIYCCYFRTDKKENRAKAPSTDIEEKYIGSFSPNFFNHLYPFTTSLLSSDLCNCAFVNVEFSSSPPISPSVVEERKAKGIEGFMEKDDGEKFHDRPLSFRSTSHDSRLVNFHCQLQVIQEVNEEEISDGEFAVCKYEA